MKINGEIEISKFKLKNKRQTAEVHCAVLCPNGLLLEDAKIEVYDAPHPDLLDAIDALLPLAIGTHMLDSDSWLEAGEVNGVKFKLDSNQQYGVSLSVQNKTDDGGVALVNSTIKSEDMDREQAIVLRLIEEIEKYLSGKKAQGDLLNYQEEEAV